MSPTTTSFFLTNTKRLPYDQKKTCREQAPSAGVNGPQSASEINQIKIPLLGKL